MSLTAVCDACASSRTGERRPRFFFLLITELRDLVRRREVEEVGGSRHGVDVSDETPVMVELRRENIVEMEGC
mgnify:CR=1 FL=1